MIWVRAFAAVAWEIWVTAKPDRMAAALAYFSMFSFVPLLYVALTVAGIFLNDSLIVHEVEQQLAYTFGPEVTGFITSLLQKTNAQRADQSLLISLVSLGILLYIASGLFGSLEDMLNIILGNPFPQKQGWLVLIRTQFLSFVLVIGLGLAVVGVTVADIGIELVNAFLAIQVPFWVSDGLLWFMTAVVAFGIIYRLLARVKPPWRLVGLGALVAGLLLSLGRWLFGLYLQLSNLSTAFAAASVLVVILLAVYYGALIFLVGAMIIRIVPETQARVNKELDLVRFGDTKPG